MNTRALVLLLAFAGLCLFHPSRTSAHRVDEYLQASRVSVDKDRVNIELSLTPGASLASLALYWIDSDHDGHISRTEGEEYARQVLRSLELVVDGSPLPLALSTQQFPEFEEMSLGVGTIRLRGAAKLPGISDGDHRLVFRNTHRPEWSVYLANALVPDDDRVEIVGQLRDVAQRELVIEYRVLPGPQPAASPWFAKFGTAVVAAFFVLQSLCILANIHLLSYEVTPKGVSEQAGRFPFL